MDAPALEDAAAGRAGSVLMAGISHQRITELLGLAPTGDTREFARVSGFTNADASAIVFAQDEVALAKAVASAAGLILAPLSARQVVDVRVLAVRNPKYAFALIGQWLEGGKTPTVHPTAIIEAGVTLGVGCSIGAGSVIEAGAVIGDLCEIGPNVVIHGVVTLGSRCVVQAGAVLGSTGFGYVTGPDGRHLRFPQIGTLWIGDDVEIGAGTTIDKGALGETRIGRGTKIDNLSHVAHNCIIGEDCLLAAQVGMAGSCVIEDGAMLGGQVGLGERVTIGKGTILGGQGGVLPGKRIDGAGIIYWGTPAQPVREYLRTLARTRRTGK
jgi:UDP-3-O-[3-hydroxymyristoyl] glucosamine N-acyltransferase